MLGGFLCELIGEQISFCLGALCRVGDLDTGDAFILTLIEDFAHPHKWVEDRLSIHAEAFGYTFGLE